VPWCQSAGCKGTADTRHLRAERLTIRVDESQVSIDGKGVTLPTERQVLIDILGEPSRVSRRANTLLTWDQLGLVAYEEPNDGLIVQITVAGGCGLRRSVSPRQGNSLLFDWGEAGCWDLDGPAIPIGSRITLPSPRPIHFLGLDLMSGGMTLRADGILLHAGTTLYWSAE
jgi:hypothetical protein